MAITAVMRTRDGQYRVFIHEDQTAELVDASGKTIIGRSPMYEISRRLAELGVSGEDLVED